MSASTHYEPLKHHFDNLEQQHSSEKLGMWMFLATEVLFFSGLFVAYTVYRHFYPSEFAFASSSSGTRFGIAALAAGKKKPVATPVTAASTTRPVALSTNGSAAKTPKRARSATIMSRRRESRSMRGPSRNPMRTIGRKSAMRSAAIHSPDSVSSLIWSTRATAAR